jgi:amino acid transporter
MDWAEAFTTPDTNHSQFAFLGFQLLGVATFGEAEFWLALLKLLGLVAYFLFSIV